MDDPQNVIRYFEHPVTGEAMVEITTPDGSLIEQKL